MDYKLETHDFNDPDPWVALGLDRSTFFHPAAKEALLRGNATRSRQFLLPVIRPLAPVPFAPEQIGASGMVLGATKRRRVFPSRARRRVSISGALFPVAQTRKTKPNFST